ncbi:MAG: GDSL-type esterase/lipase family protein [Akkermansia sp.]
MLGKECILFVGDSITQGWEQEGAEWWKKVFLPMKAVNFGVSGDRTENILWRMEDTELAVKTPPRYCVLLAGTNNIGRWEGSTRGRNGKGHPGSGRALLKVPGNPSDPDGGDALRSRPSAPLRKRQEEINERLRGLKLPRTTVLSINGRLLNADGTFREGMFRDKVHLTAKAPGLGGVLMPLLNREG